MSNKEFSELSDKLDMGLLLAEKRMLHEKALRGEDVVVLDKDDRIKYIPAKKVIEENTVFQ